MATPHKRYTVGDPAVSLIEPPQAAPPRVRRTWRDFYNWLARQSKPLAYEYDPLESFGTPFRATWERRTYAVPPSGQVNIPPKARTVSEADFWSQGNEWAKQASARWSVGEQYSTDGLKPPPPEMREAMRRIGEQLERIMNNMIINGWPHVRS